MVSVTHPLYFSLPKIQALPNKTVFRKDNNIQVNNAKNCTNFQHEDLIFGGKDPYTPKTTFCYTKIFRYVGPPPVEGRSLYLHPYIINCIYI